MEATAEQAGKHFEFPVRRAGGCGEDVTRRRGMPECPRGSGSPRPPQSTADLPASSLDGTRTTPARHRAENSCAGASLNRRASARSVISVSATDRSRFASSAELAVNPQLLATRWIIALMIVLASFAMPQRPARRSPASGTVPADTHRGENRADFVRALRKLFAQMHFHGRRPSGGRTSPESSPAL